MIAGLSVLALIPARGGSKGVPRKNIREVGGRPLIAWTIEAAQRSAYIDRVVLSSEDPEIIETARRWGCEIPFARPAELAEDHTPGIDPVLHALSLLPGYDLVVLLQPTSPMRTTEDIDRCIERCVEEGKNACVSVTESAKSPYWMYRMRTDDTLAPILEPTQGQRRQDLPVVYALNGAVYVARVPWLTENRTFVTPETVAYVMPPERSLDIDTPIDLTVLTVLMEEKDANV